MSHSLINRAAKILAVKVGGLEKKSATLAITAKMCASAYGPGMNPTGLDSFSKFGGKHLCSPSIS